MHEHAMMVASNYTEIVLLYALLQRGAVGNAALLNAEMNDGCE